MTEPDRTIGIRYVVGDPNGVIRQIGITQSLIDLIGTLPEGAVAVSGGEEADHDAAMKAPWAWRLVGNLLEPRTEMNCAIDKASITPDGEDVATLSGAPKDAEIELVQGKSRTTGTADGGPIELTATAPGRLIVKVTHPAHLDWTGIIHAT